MNTNRKRCAIVLLVLLAVSFICMLVADRIQRSGGQVEIIDGFVPTDSGKLTYKLYKPVTATEENKAPAVLLLHGYQNDHETCAAYAIELSRRGVVVLCLDEYGHGSSEVGLIERGYVNHKVSVNYGNESEKDGTYASIGGTKRYRLMMNFSNLSFFNDYYSKDTDGNVLTDSSAGGSAAYQYLADLPYVDSSRMGLSGHSMGTWSSWSVAADYSGTEIQPKATVLQCGELFRDSVYDPSIQFSNVLLLQAKWDEFSYFRDYAPIVSDELLTTPLRLEFLDTDADSAAWNTTYGSFEDGTARRIQLLYTNHRLTTHNKTGLAVALDWFDQALDLPGTIAPSDLVFGGKELLVFVAMMCVLASMFPLMELLLDTPVFSGIPQTLPSEKTILPKGKWWGSALTAVLLSGATFPFMTQLGHALLPVPENIFRMTIGTGFFAWYLLLIVFNLGSIAVSKHKAKKSGKTYNWNAQGLAGKKNSDRFGWQLMFRCLLLALCMTGLVYLCNWLFTALFDLDLRIIWPFFRVFTVQRLGQFFVYFPFYFIFFLLTHGKSLGTLRTKATYQKGTTGFMKDLLKNFLVMTGGVLLIALIEYIPFFSDIGPGADLLFGSTFGGPFMSILILFAPQVLFYSIVGTICYRKTGSAFTSASVSAILACWIVTGGSSIL